MKPEDWRLSRAQSMKGCSQGSARRHCLPLMLRAERRTVLILTLSGWAMLRSTLLAGLTAIAFATAS